MGTRLDFTLSPSTAVLSSRSRVLPLLDTPEGAPERDPEAERERANGERLGERLDDDPDVPSPEKLCDDVEKLADEAQSRATAVLFSNTEATLFKNAHS